MLNGERSATPSILPTSPPTRHSQPTTTDGTAREHPAAIRAPLCRAAPATNCWPDSSRSACRGPRSAAPKICSRTSTSRAGGATASTSRCRMAEPHDFLPLPWKSMVALRASAASQAPGGDSLEVLHELGLSRGLRRARARSAPSVRGRDAQCCRVEAELITVRSIVGDREQDRPLADGRIPSG